MFHLQTTVSGFLPERVHGQRGRAVTHGISDLRGVAPGGEDICLFAAEGGGLRTALGGICEFGASQGLPISNDGNVYAFQLPPPFGARFGTPLKNALRDQALGQHLASLVMQAEDAPQRTNRVDLDPRFVDVHGLPVSRVTYKSHSYELDTRKSYIPILKQIVQAAGAKAFSVPLLPNFPPQTVYAFVQPREALLGGAPTSRHVMGTLRMGPSRRRRSWIRPAASTTSTTSTRATAASFRRRPATTRRSRSSPSR